MSLELAWKSPTSLKSPAPAWSEIFLVKEKLKHHWGVGSKHLRKSSWTQWKASSKPKCEAHLSSKVQPWSSLVWQHLLEGGPRLFRRSHQNKKKSQSTEHCPHTIAQRSDGRGFKCFTNSYIGWQNQPGLDLHVVRKSRRNAEMFKQNASQAESWSNIMASLDLIALQQFVSCCFKEVRFKLIEL